MPGLSWGTIPEIGELTLCRQQFKRFPLPSLFLKNVRVGGGVTESSLSVIGQEKNKSLEQTQWEGYCLKEKYKNAKYKKHEILL